MKACLIRLLRRFSVGLSFMLLIAAFLIVVLWDSIVYTIPVGYSGVLWHRISIFGGAQSRGPLAEGLHIALPWDKIYVYDMRLQNHRERYQVLSKDGLEFEIELSFRWRLAPDKLVELNQTVGPDYLNTLIVQEIGSVTRSITAKYTAEALFTDTRTEVQKEIFDSIMKVSFVDEVSISRATGMTLNSSGLDSERIDLVTLIDILIKDVRLPVAYRQAIERKLEQSQVVEEYRFRVAREALESERKRVEAEGIRSFQEIVTPGISESYLRWQGIEATLKLAQSPNSKVVVIGNAATGLPLILDTTTGRAIDESVSATPSSASAASLDDHLRNGQFTSEEFELQAVPGQADTLHSFSPVAPTSSVQGTVQPETGSPISVREKG